MKRVRFFSQILFLLALVLGLYACSAEKDSVKIPIENEDDVSLGTETILFIGNSHTYYNQGISAHLKKFRSFDDLDFEPLIQEVAKGGYTLQDHLMDEGTVEKVKERSWDVIILQENTSVAAQNLPSTTQAMAAFSDLVSQQNTKLFLYMTWPYLENPEMLSKIKKTYEDGAAAATATVVPVGKNWLTIHTNEEVAVNLYDPDGIHPSIEGTFYATAMFYKSIYEKPPSNNPYQGDLGSEIANFLKTKAN